MARIVTTRAPTRPQRVPDGEREPLDPHVGDTTLPGIDTRSRPLPPVGRQGRDLGGDVSGRPSDDVRDSGGRDDGGGIEAPAARSVFADISVGGISSRGTVSPVSAAAIAKLVSALEEHGRRNAIAHDRAIDVLQRLRNLVEQVTERRTWPKVTRVRRRVPRTRREP
jgi:hypothetical protein